MVRWFYEYVVRKYEWNFILDEFEYEFWVR